MTEHLVDDLAVFGSSAMMSADTASKGAIHGRKLMKNYSFLNALDNMASSPAEWSLGPSIIRRTEDPVRRISALLHSLSDDKHGSKHLPEKPAQEKDSVASGVASSGSRRSRKHVRRQSRQGIAKQKCTVQHLPRMSLGESFDSSSFVMSQLKCFGENTSRRSSYHDVLNSQVRGDDLSHPKHRPVAVCRTSAPGRSREQPRTGAPTPSLRTRHRRKRSITFDDQRYVFKIQEPKTITQTPPRRRFRLMNSFKDLPAELDEKQQIQQTILPPSPDESVAMLTLQEALQVDHSPVPPLHDAVQDRIFTEQCAQMLSLNTSQSQFSFLAPQSTHNSPGSPFEGDESRPSSASKHEYRQSEASMMSIGTSILDWEWPRPSAYTSVDEDTLRVAQVGRRDSTTLPNLLPGDTETPVLSGTMATPKLGDKALLETWTKESTPQLMIPSPTSTPPRRPLPSLPQVPHKIDHFPNSDQRQQAEYRQGKAAKSLPETIQKASISSDRMRKLASSKALRIDATASSAADFSGTDADECSDGMRVSPLRLKFNSSNRAVKVTELRKRHISMLTKDNQNIGDPVNDEPRAGTHTRPGTAPEATPRLAVDGHAVPMSGCNGRLLAYKDKPLPDPPVLRSRSMRSSRSPQNSGCLSNEVGHTNLQLARQTHTKLPLTPSSTPVEVLTQSKIMTLVDSNPDIAHGFRAGAIGTSQQDLQRQNKMGPEMTEVKRPFGSFSSDASRASSVQSTYSFARSDGTNMTAPSMASSFESDTSPKLTDSGSQQLRRTRAVSSATKYNQSSKLNDVAEQRATFIDPRTGASAQANVKVGELYDELARLTRVQKALSRAEKESVLNGSKPKSFAELLEQDRLEPASFSVRERPHQLIQIEENSMMSPAKADSDSDRTITPLTGQISVYNSPETRESSPVQTVRPRPRVSQPSSQRLPALSANSIRASPYALANASDVRPSPQAMQRVHLPASPASASRARTRGSNRASVSSQSLTKKTNATPTIHSSKRYSIMSTYNPYPPASRFSASPAMTIKPASTTMKFREDGEAVRSNSRHKHSVRSGILLDQ